MMVRFVYETPDQKSAVISAFAKAIPSHEFIEVPQVTSSDFMSVPHLQLNIKLTDFVNILFTIMKTQTVHLFDLKACRR